jgi:adenine/guanine/hypoxanthine permease
LLSFTGLIHAYELTAAGVQNRFGFAAAPDFALIYGISALILTALHLRSTKP